MTNKCGRTRQRTNNLRDKPIWGMNSTSELPPCITTHVGVSRAVASLLRQVTKLSVSLHQQNDIAIIDIFNEKRKSCNHRYPDSVYFHMLLLIIHLSAIERLICRIEMSLIGLLPSVLHKYDTRFSKYGIELIVALSSTNATKS